MSDPPVSSRLRSTPRSDPQPVDEADGAMHQHDTIHPSTDPSSMMHHTDLVNLDPAAGGVADVADHDDAAPPTAGSPAHHTAAVTHRKTVAPFGL